MPKYVKKSVADALDAYQSSNETAQLRADATGQNLSMFTEKELQSMEAIITKSEQRELYYAEDIPVDTSDPEGAETVSYLLMEGTGLAKIINSKSKDLPRVGAFVKKFYKKVHSIGTSYAWDFFEMLNAQMAGRPLSSDLAEEARRAINEKKNDIAYNGDLNTGVTGLLNDPNVAIVAAQAGSGSGSATMIGKTGAEIVEELRRMKQVMTVASKNMARPNTWLVDPDLHDYMAYTPMDSETNGRTIMDYVLGNNGMGITSIRPREECRNANPTGGSRYVFYELSPLVVRFKEPMSIRQLNAQEDGLEMKVPVVARVAGVQIRRSYAIVYYDDAN